MALARPDRAWRFALICLAGSVIGGAASLEEALSGEEGDELDPISLFRGNHRHIALHQEIGDREIDRLAEIVKEERRGPRSWRGRD